MTVPGKTGLLVTLSMTLSLKLLYRSILIELAQLLKVYNYSYHGVNGSQKCKVFCEL